MTLIIWDLVLLRVVFTIQHGRAHGHQPQHDRTDIEPNQENKYKEIPSACEIGTTTHGVSCDLDIYTHHAISEDQEKALLSMKSS